MKKSLVRIAPLKAGIVSACLYTFGALLLLPVFVISMIIKASSEEEATSIAIGMLMGVVLVGIYALGGFVVGVIGAAVYNLIAKFTVGLEFETEEISGKTSHE